MKVLLGGGLLLVAILVAIIVVNIMGHRPMMETTVAEPILFDRGEADSRTAFWVYPEAAGKCEGLPSWFNPAENSEYQFWNPAGPIEVKIEVVSFFQEERT